MLRVVILLGLMLTVGCDVGGGIQPAIIPDDVQAKSDQPLVAHPEYAHWSRFAVGSHSIRRKEVVGKNGKTIVVTRVELKQKTDSKVVVEMQVTVKRGDEPERVNEPDIAEYPVTFQIPNGMSVEQFNLPSLKAKMDGEEEIEVNGKAYKCQKFTWTETNEAGPMEVSVWRSDEVPGRTVKEVSATKDVEESATEIVVEIVTMN